jgi:hypothetical protein
VQRPAVVVAGMEYQQWTDFQRSVLALPDMPDPQSWLQDGLPNHWVNAARIWIRDAHGQIKRFTQPKRHPQADEQAIPLYQGRNVLVFRSSTQTDGRRLNFLTQICSDFTDAAFVRELRRQIAVDCEGLRIDFTVLLHRGDQPRDSHNYHPAVRQPASSTVAKRHAAVSNDCDWSLYEYYRRVIAVHAGTFKFRSVLPSPSAIAMVVRSLYGAETRPLR